MNISNFKDVKKLIEALEKIEKIIVRVSDVIENIEHHKDSGGVGGVLETGYNFHISSHRDGSGNSVDLSGCYVGLESALAIKNVLENKKKEITEKLEEYGVDFSVQSDKMIPQPI